MTALAPLPQSYIGTKTIGKDMFGSIDKSKGLLFVTHDLDHSLQTTMQSMRQEVESLDENRLLNTAPEKP